MAISFRHIHLDFHTSPLIEAVGRDFDPQDFAKTLSRAGVTSINCFARCHHGHLYYPSKVNPERIHPHLERPNLLPEQIEACHREGIRVPIYTTVQWDLFTADEHPEWLLRDDEGKPVGRAPLLDPTHGFYDRLDVSHPGYIAFLQAHVRELFDAMPVDGLWFDIVVPHFSYDRRWLDAMDEAGLDLTRSTDRTTYARRVIDRFKLEMTEFVRSLHAYKPDCTMFYNSGHVGTRHRSSMGAYTHYELESLPSGGWGYMHFPASQRYARGLGKPTLGMTGKFHSSWGDFHGYKNEAALDFEVFNMLALGATACIGDQLPPQGVLDAATYELVGRVYKQVEAKEPWCRSAEAVTEIAVMHPEEFGLEERDPDYHSRARGRSDFGVVRLLQELGHQFDMVSTDRDLAGYRLLILPDEIPVDDALCAKLQAFLDRGGALIASARAGLTPDGDGFALPWLGVDWVGDATYEPDFLVPGPAVRAGLADTRYVMDQRAQEVRPAEGAEVLAECERPYFNRTWNAFCSHQYAPSTREVVYPAVVRQGAAIYLAHPVFRMYDDRAARWVKRLVRNAIDLLMPNPMIEHDGPSSVVVALNDQPSESRYALHLLHYVPERRGNAFDTIEDVIPLHDLQVTVRPPTPIDSARLVPSGDPLPIERSGDAIAFTVPRLEGHQIVELRRA